MTDVAFTDEQIEAGRKLFAGPVAFVKGVVSLDGLPPSDRPEFAFAGRVDHFARAVRQVHAVFLKPLLYPRADLARVAIGVGVVGVGGIAVTVDDVGARVGAAELGHHAAGFG